MRTVPRFLPHLAALAIVVGSGLVHGRWTGRWANSTVMVERVAALGRVPMTIGDWEGQALELDRRTLEAAGIEGYVMRRYQDRRSGHSVMLLLVCGLPGPVSVHTPEVCYEGLGYLLQGSLTRSSVGPSSEAPSDAFWVAELRKPRAIAAATLQIFYAWSAGGVWGAPDSSRWEYAGEPALYKLYVVRETTTDEETIQDGPAAEFVRALVPELRRSLLASPTA